MKTKRTHWVECRQDDVLAIHQTQVGAREVAAICIVSFISLILAGQLIIAPFTAKSPLSRNQNALALGAGLGILVIGPTLAAILYSRAIRGVWIIDSRGIEFSPRRDQGFRIAWKDVQSVMCRQRRVVLRSAGRRIVLEQGLLAESDWNQVRERVEEVLSSRFDLTVKAGLKQELNPLRVLGLALPGGLLTALVMLSLPSVSPTFSKVVVLVMLVIMSGALLVCGICMYRESERRDPTWRVAKSKVGAWEDWDL